MRAILIVLDSVGIGSAPDADRHGDWGADTLGHIFTSTPTLALPALFSIGLGEVLSGGGQDKGIHARYGRIRTAAAGKDSASAHWEMAGAILKQPFAVFEKLPPQLVEAIEADARVDFLGKDGRDTDWKELRKQHAAAGRPILHIPPGESAIEIFAHESLVAKARLYEISRIARRHATGYRIARVVAQPLTGKPASATETAGRHEYHMTPPRTVLNAISEAGLVVEGIGKVPDLFGRSGITHAHHARTNADALHFIDRLWDRTHDGLIFANIPDFDTHGHARDVAAFAKSLVEFDAWLTAFLPRLTPEDLLVITADHGNDPTFRGAGHTREELPLLVRCDGMSGPIPTRETLADIAATLAAFFRLKEKWTPGKPFLDFKIKKPGKVQLKRPA